MTVVEFLKQNLPSLFLEDSGHYAELFEQAEELFEQQIKDAYDHCRCIGNFDSGTEYYNETYKKPLI
jgi:hypothetical protein